MFADPWPAEVLVRYVIRLGGNGRGRMEGILSHAAAAVLQQRIRPERVRCIWDNVLFTL